MLDAASRLESATLRVFLEDIQGSPAGPVSLLHSVNDNDLDQLPSDFEDTIYSDTLLDLVQPTDLGQMYYEADVTAFVLADYAEDDSNPLSAFRMEISEAVFFEDDHSHGYRFTMPGAENNHPELVLAFASDSLLGDMNLDGVVNGLDVDPFVDVLLNGSYQTEADMNEDQVVNGLDVDPFVAAVVGGTQPVPEPSTLVLALVALGMVGGWRKWKTGNRLLDSGH